MLFVISRYLWKWWNYAESVVEGWQFEIEKCWISQTKKFTFSCHNQSQHEHSKHVLSIRKHAWYKILSYYTYHFCERKILKSQFLKIYFIRYIKVWYSKMSTWNQPESNHMKYHWQNFIEIILFPTKLSQKAHHYEISLRRI